MNQSTKYPFVASCQRASGLRRNSSGVQAGPCQIILKTRSLRSMLFSHVNGKALVLANAGKSSCKTRFLKGSSSLQLCGYVSIYRRHQCFPHKGGAGRCISATRFSLHPLTFCTSKKSKNPDGPEPRCSKRPACLELTPSLRRKGNENLCTPPGTLAEPSTAKLRAM